jgi:hypothetical protein
MNLRIVFHLQLEKFCINYASLFLFFFSLFFYFFEVYRVVYEFRI